MKSLAEMLLHSLRGLSLIQHCHLEGVAASRSEEATKSKDPCMRVLEMKAQGILTLLRENALKQHGKR